MSDSDLAAPQQLSSQQRRVLGVLIEKSLTTPDAYPMTLNAIVSGCNQKSNRSPLVQYDADDVEQTLDELREADLVNIVISDGGRVERFRQLSRIVFGWSDEHVAIMAELMLRGRQQLGELRSRASRMTQIESLERLRLRLSELIEAGFLQASGPLERRGIEVDHQLYAEGGPAMPAASAAATTTPAAPSPSRPASATTTPPPSDTLRELQDEVATLREQLESLSEEVRDLQSKLDSVL